MRGAGSSRLGRAGGAAGSSSGFSAEEATAANGYCLVLFVEPTSAGGPGKPLGSSVVVRRDTLLSEVVRQWRQAFPLVAPAKATFWLGGNLLDVRKTLQESGFPLYGGYITVHT